MIPRFFGPFNLFWECRTKSANRYDLCHYRHLRRNHIQLRRFSVFERRGKGNQWFSIFFELSNLFWECRTKSAGRYDLCHRHHLRHSDLQPPWFSIFERKEEGNQRFFISLGPSIPFENVEPSSLAITINPFENVESSMLAIMIYATVVIYAAVIFNLVDLAFSKEKGMGINNSLFLWTIQSLSRMSNQVRRSL